MEVKEIIYPAQCRCGHLFLEKYKIKEPNNGVVGFCWCGFCKSRLNIRSDNSFSYVVKD